STSPLRCIIPMPRRSPLLPCTTLSRSPGFALDRPLPAKPIEPGASEHPRQLIIKLNPQAKAAKAEQAAMHRKLGIGSDQLRHFRSEEHTSELQSREKLVCRLLLEKKKQ